MSGQTPEFRIGEFIVRTASISPISEALHQTAVENASGVVESMERSFDPGSHSLPPKAMFKDAVEETRKANPAATWEQAVFSSRCRSIGSGRPALRARSPTP